MSLSSSEATTQRLPCEPLPMDWFPRPCLDASCHRQSNPQQCANCSRQQSAMPWPASVSLRQAATGHWSIDCHVTFQLSLISVQKNVRNPNHHYFSKKYRNRPPICIAIPLPNCIAVLSVPLRSEEREILSVFLPFVSQYASHLYCNMPPIYIAVFLVKSWWLWSLGWSPSVTQLIMRFNFHSYLLDLEPFPLSGQICG